MNLIIRVREVENHDKKYDLILKFQRLFSYHSYYNGLLDIIISVISFVQGSSDDIILSDISNS